MDNQVHNDPFALCNLFAAGTICVDVSRVAPELHRTNGTWTSLSGYSVHLIYGDETLSRSLDYLIEHQYIRASYRLSTTGCFLYIRIYLIPRDLSNVQGRLRNVGETVKKEARKCLQLVLGRLVQSKYSWNRNYSQDRNSPANYFLPQDIVSKRSTSSYSHN